MTDNTIEFLLNDELTTLKDFDPNLTILQYLRQQADLTGTKEGCASGDCGACTVVVASVEDGQLNYQSVNSCIGFVGSLHGKQLISVEHLKQQGQLHPVQQALVDCHGSQCGFCTPGFVMSSFALHQHHPSPSKDEVLEALAGNLCRCTGYRSIVEAAMQSTEHLPADSFSQNQANTLAKLINITTARHIKPDADCHFFAPDTTEELAQHLLAHPDAKILAGGTDLALSVTQNLAQIDKLIYIGNVKELSRISQDENQWSIGAAASYQQFTPLLAAHYPELGQMIERIGSTQIRNVGTIGGNIGNASPIGDMPPALIALDAKVTLQKGEVKRQISLADYFKDYKVTDLAPSEFIHSVQVPKPLPHSQLKVYKISKRIDDDISAVLAVIHIQIENNRVEHISIAFGGMAAIPKHAYACEAAMRHQVFNQATIDQAKQALLQDFSPMSDVRASKEYRMKVAQNLLQKCFIELQQRTIETRVTHYA